MKCTRYGRRGFIPFFVATALLMEFSVLPAQTPTNFKIAFIGDQGLNSDSRAVLNLIKSEGAQAVLHQGDFDYSDDPDAWENQINSILGANFPYFASAGNHDEAEWPGYQQHMENRLNRLGITWNGELGARSSLTYRGIYIILVAPDVNVPGASGLDTYIRDRLAADNSIWSICSWHKNMEAMQAGGKSDETGWGVYEESRKGGAIIATGHEHSYSRTHLLSSCQNQTVASTSNTLVLAKDAAGTSQDEGRTFVFVSGLGGQSIRDQELSGNWWASIYTASQGANAGALFGVFNLNGQANRAHFYFKDIEGRIADEFEVVSNVTGSGTPSPSAPTISSFTPTSGPVGTEVTVVGNNFNGTTRVTFNGTDANGFTIASNSQIRVDVPVGATTGRIRVTSQAGSATSSNDFVVSQQPQPSQTITLNPTDDAYVRSDNASDNFGSSSTLRVRQSSPTYRSYLKFAVSGASGTVQSAKLRLRVTEGSGSGGSVFLVSNTYSSSSTQWDESDLTYQNAPTLSGNALSTVGGVSAGAWVEFDVTAAITGNGTFSLGLQSTSSSTVRYSSKEGNDDPQLVVQMTATPPPPPPGTAVTLHPTEDAYVRSDNASDNFGSSSTLRVRQSSPTYRSYLKFAVSGASGTVQSAKLRLRVTEGSGSGGSVFLVSNTYRSSSTQWDESDLTYENAPTLSGNALSTVSGVSAGAWVEFDVTAAITGNGTFSLGLQSTSSSTVRYSSKEGDDAPELVIQIGGTASASAAGGPLKTGETSTLNLAAGQKLDRVMLAPSHPNPFNAQIVIEYALPEEAYVSLAVYNSIGQLVRQLVNETQPPGAKHVIWDSRDDNDREVGSGVYLSRLQVGGQTFVQKMTLQK
ncbi:MAG: DUF7594 domain-containing protein [bacterium]